MADLNLTDTDRKILDVLSGLGENGAITADEVEERVDANTEEERDEVVERLLRLRAEGLTTRTRATRDQQRWWLTDEGEEAASQS